MTNNLSHKITACEKCDICKNQKPLMDKIKGCQIFWVGLSAKISLEDKRPLSPETNSGRLISQIEAELPGVQTYRTNIVKCVPLSEENKLRYPNQKEINACLPYLDEEIEELSPKIIFLLGEKAIKAVSKRYSIIFDKWDAFNYKAVQYNRIWFIPIHHPSYIYVYKRKYIDEYIANIVKTINKLL